MPSSRTYSPEAIERMATVYKHAVQKLKLEYASIHERERIANCILSIGNGDADLRRMLDQSIRLYRRLAVIRRYPRRAMGAFHDRTARIADSTTCFNRSLATRVNRQQEPPAHSERNNDTPISRLHVLYV